MNRIITDITEWIVYNYRQIEVWILSRIPVVSTPTVDIHIFEYCVNIHNSLGALTSTISITRIIWTRSQSGLNVQLFVQFAIHFVNDMSSNFSWYFVIVFKITYRKVSYQTAGNTPCVQSNNRLVRRNRRCDKLNISVSVNINESIQFPELNEFYSLFSSLFSAWNLELIFLWGWFWDFYTGSKVPRSTIN